MHINFPWPGPLSLFFGFCLELKSPGCSLVRICRAAHICTAAAARVLRRETSHGEEQSTPSATKCLAAEILIQPQMGITVICKRALVSRTPRYIHIYIHFRNPECFILSARELAAKCGNSYLESSAADGMLQVLRGDAREWKNLSARADKLPRESRLITCKNAGQYIKRASINSSNDTLPLMPPDYYGALTFSIFNFYARWHLSDGLSRILFMDSEKKKKASER